MSTILRYFSRARFTQSLDWIPHYPIPSALAFVFASMFPGPLPALGEALWLFVNRAGHDVSGPQLSVGNMSSSLHFFDCYHGNELAVANDAVHFTVEAGGFGCVIATPNATVPGDASPLGEFLAVMSAMTALPLASFNATWTYLPQTLVAMAPTTLYTAPPAGMVPIPAGQFAFVVNGVEIEGDDAHGVDVQYPWESHPQREHNHVLRMPAFYIDRFPVTNANYSHYLRASGYVPRDPYNFLRHWVNGTFPPGTGDRPVVWVSYSEAMAYCRFVGRRLPHETEWQYAAQGSTGYLYPWGNALVRRCFHAHLSLST
jgi:iron(II)-dependent oxidoreductase